MYSMAKRSISEPFLRGALVALQMGATAFFLLSILQLVHPITLNYSTSKLIFDTNGRLISATLNQDDKWRFPIEEDTLPLDIVKAISLKEDRWFWHHPGVSPAAIVRAFFQNMAQGKRVSGASTITMQVVRLLHPAARTWPNKVREMGEAVLLEGRYSKLEILRTYLNLLPYGGNIEGINSAARLYYGTSASRLTLAQIATLITIPNRPTTLCISKPGEVLLASRNRWIVRLGNALNVPENAIAFALHEPLVLQRQPLPHLAMQACQRVQHLATGALVATTLEASLQQKAEDAVANTVNRLKLMGVGNAAALIVDNHTRAIIAYVGSADAEDEEHDGQVDGVIANRSPGSTLKPLVYAMAMDQGSYTPKTVLYDVPQDFDGYRPENFDKKYNGAITVSTALENSLNLPAVKTLGMVGPRVFAQRLGQAGFAWVGSHQNTVGLSMVLGGCVASLRELAGLYVSFANGGQYRPLRLLKSDTVLPPTKQIISRGAAYLVTEMLAKLNRPDLPNNFENSISAPRIAWKTGTSYGRKDAWAIGYDPDYTVAVWCGNFDGQGVPDLSGADVATPLLFKLFSLLPPRKAAWFLPPPEVEERLVCTQSGRVPSPDCQQTAIDQCLRLISASILCAHNKAVPVAADGQMSYCNACVPPAGVMTRYYPNLPSEYTTWLARERLPVEQPPPHNPACNRMFSGQAPLIVSLANEREYLFERNGRPPQLQLVAQANADVREVYWFLDNKFLGGQAPSTHPLCPVSEGEHTVTLTDDKGRSSSCHFTVRLF